jgi:acyl CoA:acetate/3-ketoacid CoA transferase beta subunit
VIEVTEHGFLLTEYAADLSPEEVQKATGANLKISPQCRPMTV